MYLFRVRTGHATGSIITEIGRLSNAKGVDMSHNQLAGTSQVVGSSSPTVGGPGARPYRNELACWRAGNIPTEIGRMGALEELKLGNNLLTGTRHVGPPPYADVHGCISR